MHDLVFFGHGPKRFWNDQEKLSHFGQNVWKQRLKNTVTASFSTTVRQMTELFQQKNDRNVSAKKKTVHNTVAAALARLKAPGGGTRYVPPQPWLSSFFRSENRFSLRADPGRALVPRAFAKSRCCKTKFCRSLVRTSPSSGSTPSSRTCSKANGRDQGSHWWTETLSEEETLLLSWPDGLSVRLSSQVFAVSDVFRLVGSDAYACHSRLIRRNGPVQRGYLAQVMFKRWWNYIRRLPWCRCPASSWDGLRRRCLGELS